MKPPKRGATNDGHPIARVDWDGTFVSGVTDLISGGGWVARAAVG
jgi:hypothetical protein